jgi:hypothetical protein
VRGESPRRARVPPPMQARESPPESGERARVPPVWLPPVSARERRPERARVPYVERGGRGERGERAPAVPGGCPLICVRFVCVLRELTVRACERAGE